MRTKRIVITVVVLALMASLVWKLSANKEIVDARQNESEEVSFAIPIKTEIVKSENVSRITKLTGEFEAEESVFLIAETQGSITNISISDGSYVKKGSESVRIDDSSLRAQYSSAKAVYDKSLKDLERYKKLYESGAVSKQQIEDVELTLKNTEANMESIKEQLGFTVVKSPIAGYVNEVLVEEGEFIMQGDQVAEVFNVDKLKFILKVSESQLSGIKEKAQVNIQTDAYPLKTFTGKVSQISFKADDSKKYKVTILVSNDTEYPLRAGMFGTASFSDNDDAGEDIVIPRRAIIGSLKDAQVYVVRDGKAYLNAITVGDKVDDKVIVLEGLSPSQVVVVSGHINLTDGAEIRVVNQ